MLRASHNNIFLTFCPFSSHKIHLGLSISHNSPYRHEIIKVSPTHNVIFVYILLSLPIGKTSGMSQRLKFICRCLSAGHFHCLGDSKGLFLDRKRLRGEVLPIALCLSDQNIDQCIGKSYVFGMWSHRMGLVSPTMCMWTFFSARQVVIGMRSWRDLIVSPTVDNNIHLSEKLLHWRDVLVSGSSLADNVNVLYQRLSG